MKAFLKVVAVLVCLAGIALLVLTLLRRRSRPQEYISLHQPPDEDAQG